MVTFYIDVYFLINFTVDTLAIVFGAALASIPKKRGRVILSSIIGSLFAVATVLLPEVLLLKLFSGVMGLVAVVWIYCFGLSLKRKVRFGFAFLIFCGLLGGAVSYLFGVLESFFGDSLGEMSSSSTNRKLLLIAVAVLISIGVFKMIVAYFAGKVCSGTAVVKIDILGKSYEGEGLLDSGNLAIDPMDSSPVVLIKESVAEKLLPRELIDLRDPDLISIDLRKRIRLIPVSTVGGTGILTGVKPNGVWLRSGDKYEEIRATVAIDREGGDFDGYGVLVPSSVVCNVKK